MRLLTAGSLVQVQHGERKRKRTPSGVLFLLHFLALHVDLRPCKDKQTPLLTKGLRALPLPVAEKGRAQNRAAVEGCSRLSCGRHPSGVVNFCDSPSHRTRVLGLSEVLTYDLSAVQLHLRFVSRERAATANGRWFKSNTGSVQKKTHRRVCLFFYLSMMRAEPNDLV